MADDTSPGRLPPVLLEPTPDRPSVPAGPPGPPGEQGPRGEAGPLAGGWPQAVVLSIALIGVSVLACLGKLDGGVLVALYVVILGAAGAQVAVAKGKLPPAGGAAAVVVMGIATVLAAMARRA